MEWAFGEDGDQVLASSSSVSHVTSRSAPKDFKRVSWKAVAVPERQAIPRLKHMYNMFRLFLPALERRDGFPCEMCIFRR